MERYQNVEGKWLFVHLLYIFGIHGTRGVLWDGFKNDFPKRKH